MPRHTKQDEELARQVIIQILTEYASRVKDLPAHYGPQEISMYLASQANVARTTKL